MKRLECYREAGLKTLLNRCRQKWVTSAYKDPHHTPAQLNRRSTPNCATLDIKYNYTSIVNIKEHSTMSAQTVSILRAGLTRLVQLHGRFKCIERAAIGKRCSAERFNMNSDCFETSCSWSAIRNLVEPAAPSAGNSDIRRAPFLRISALRHKNITTKHILARTCATRDASCNHSIR